MYKKTEELLYCVYPRLSNYPKSEKFCLCSDIKNAFFEILTNISLGNSVRSKRTIYLQTADGYLQKLKTLFKLSKQRKYISVQFWEEVDIRLSEINKLLSAYIRSSVNK
ncbi:MAG: four helix bundle protein [Gudongella sp.]|nr:four helix bundle protein [Gudongella sp.]